MANPEFKKLYNSKRWKIRHTQQLQEYPLCAMCLLEHKVVQPGWPITSRHTAVMSGCSMMARCSRYASNITTQPNNRSNGVVSVVVSMSKESQLTPIIRQISD